METKLEVNDNGNKTLFQYARGRRCIVLAIVTCLGYGIGIWLAILAMVILKAKS